MVRLNDRRVIARGVCSTGTRRPVLDTEPGREPARPFPLSMVAIRRPAPERRRARLERISGGMTGGPHELARRRDGFTARSRSSKPANAERGYGATEDRAR